MKKVNSMDEIINDLQMIANNDDDVFTDFDFDSLIDVNDQIVSSGDVSTWKMKLLDIGTWVSTVAQTVSSVVSFRAGYSMPTFIMKMMTPVVPVKQITGRIAGILIQNAFIKITYLPEYSWHPDPPIIPPPYEIDITHSFIWYLKRCETSFDETQKYINQFISKQTTQNQVHTLHVSYEFEGKNITMVMDISNGIHYIIYNGKSTSHTSLLFGMFSLPVDLEDYKFAHSISAPNF
jgi:hypothetical protein